MTKTTIHLWALAATLAAAGASAQVIDENTLRGSTPSASAINPADTENRVPELARYYFKERETLRLDTTRVAVYAPRGLDARSLPPLLDQDRIHPMSLGGWSLIGLAEPATIESIRAIIDELSADPRWDFASPVFLDDLGPLLITPRIIVQFDPTVPPDASDSVLKPVTDGSEPGRDWAGMRGAYLVTSRERNGLRILAIANELARRADVVFAEPDFVLTGRKAQGPDPSFLFSWGLHSPGVGNFDADWDIGARGAWAHTMGSPDVKVLILDDGIDPAHPDINQSPGADFTGQGSGGAPVVPCDDHGTWVASCVSGIQGNGIGSAGVAPLCKAVSARVFVTLVATPPCTPDAAIQPSWLVSALDWAVSQGIRITNFSALVPKSAAITAKYQQTHDLHGVVHFAASGNDGQNQVGYPARLACVNAIGAVAFDGHVTRWSNHGQKLDFVTPGTFIWGADLTNAGVPGDYVVGQGTSASSPIAAGVAALLRSLQPSLTPNDLRSLLQASARDLHNPGWDPKTGYGLIRADRAVALLLGLPVQSGVHTCDRPSVSADGRYVAFSSYASLVPADTNGRNDIYRLDNLTGAIMLVSVGDCNSQANEDSRYPSISADGRYVAFQSWADNLVSGDNTNKSDIFVRDMLLGTTTRASFANNGNKPNRDSETPSISGDGRYVAFSTNATNMGPPSSFEMSQIYVRDLLTQTTTCVSRVPSGPSGDLPSWFPSISNDGQRVAFFTLALNLVPINTLLFMPNVVVYDAASNSLTLANVDAAGLPGDGQTLWPSISGDGNKVVFTTDGALVPGDTNGLLDVYVRDLALGTTVPASTSPGGAFGDRMSGAGAISSDGRYVLFLSASSAFVAGDTNEEVDLFRKDLLTGDVIRVSVGSSGQQAMGSSGHPWVSLDGNLVIFTSQDDLLTPGDALDGASDIYIRTVSAGITQLLTPGS